MNDYARGIIDAWAQDLWLSLQHVCEVVLSRV